MLDARLRDDLTAAMMAQDRVRTATLRLVRAAIQHAEVAGSERRSLTDEEITAVLQAELKKRAEAADAYAAGRRPERAEAERAEAAIIAEYLPRPLSADELEALVTRVLADGGYRTRADMGAAMRDAKAQSGGRADGRPSRT